MRKRKEFLKVVAFGLALALVWSGIPEGGLRAAAAENGEEAAENGKEASKQETPAESGEGEANETEGETESLPEVIEIRTAEDFEELAAQCRLDSWSVGKWVTLKEDIELPDDRAWAVPSFSGTFDGGGHTISGYTGGEDGYVEGLFRYIGRGGEVKNLNLRGDIQGTEEDECIGGICGVNYGTIRSCSFKGTVNGKDTVGGIAGINQGTGVITGCKITGHLSGYYTTGGIVGLNHGTVSYCQNRCGINDDSEWVETDDEMGTGLFLSVNVSDSEVDLYSGVDTGGIAGYSDGVIVNCANYGRVGYEHTGYNIGGIVGRHAGLVSLCSNYGEVYGRKDVGGIVGQMEPYIEVDEAQSLRNAVNKLHDLIGQTLDHMQDGKNVIKADMDSLTLYSDGARSSGHALADQLTTFVDENVAQVKQIGTRMEYVTDQLPSVLDQLSRAQDAFSRFGDSMKQAAEDADFGSISGNDMTVSGNNIGTIPWPVQTLEALRLPAEQTALLTQRLSEGTGGKNGAVKEWELMSAQEQETMIRTILELENETEEWSVITSKAIGELSRSGDALEGNAQNDLDEALDALQDTADCLKAAGNETRGIVNYINAQPDLHFTALGDGFRKSRDDLNAQLTGISDSLKKLSEHASDYSDLVNGDLNQVNDQLNVVFNLLADHLSGSGGLSVEEMYEEVSEQDMESIVTGRTDACTNNGTVRGDINIGGIAGAMAIDEEDPEDSAAGNMDYEIGRRFIMQCLITDSVNQGSVTAKKDGAGGIVGYMEHGIASRSEGYGSVESTEGNYVGGICGQSLTVIRNCYALCDVSGGTYVGGIAGYAYTLTDCLAIVNVEGNAGRKGAIAGWTAENEESEGDRQRVSGNYFVGGEPYGIDGISYEGIAQPVRYEELLAVEGIPGRFRHLRVFFRVDDMELGSREVAYGESLSQLEYPEIPKREGFYGVWPDYSDRVMSGDLVIRGEYKENVPVVESSEKSGAEGEDSFERPYALVSREFTEDTRLNVKVGGDDRPEEIGDRECVLYQVALENGGIQEEDLFAVRLLNPYEKAEVWGFVGGAWTRLESRERGHYLQVDMTGSEEIFCIAKTESKAVLIAAGAGILCVCAGLLGALTVRIRKHRKKRKA